jgi:polyphosphate kinase
MQNLAFFNRDISWLSFNERVLMEAGNPAVPLLERIKFLSIYSSNLDEFYRVRMPAILALQKINKEEQPQSVYKQCAEIINTQQNLFGTILLNDILPALQKYGYHFLYNEPIPTTLLDRVRHYFFTQVAGMLQPVLLEAGIDFFPENNQLYMAVVLKDNSEKEKLFFLNIPSKEVKRFFVLEEANIKYILFLEDIIQNNLNHLFPNSEIIESYNIKITRDAVLNLTDEYDEGLAEKIEKQLAKRDYGFATRFLYEPNIPLRHLQNIIEIFNLHKASIVEGGKYHNLKDLSSFPINNNNISYPDIASLQNKRGLVSLFQNISEKDEMVHAPYQSYDSVLRFFNEACIDPLVEEIFTTLYRVASDSKIVHALISAARNGKKVTVLVELKARFDEANNILWAKRMKANGVKIIYSNNELKVHAKVALVKRKHETKPYLGLLATGNLNESTARFYTDHVLLTTFQPLLGELQILFDFLSKKNKLITATDSLFKHLLVAQFNLQQRFMQLIDREIEHAKRGLPASIILKMNNLEEELMILKLYEASCAGVNIQLLIRGICRLVPGIAKQSENISIKRIVGRYLEHGRVFIFFNNGEEEIFMGSADWMNRNIYRRIEVCFPIYDSTIKKQIKHIIDLQLKDNVQAVQINAALENVKITTEDVAIHSQEAIYEYLKTIES